ncbi:MAG: DNA polymerase III subunit gamma/tau [Deltaproteobacteria bacterium]|nr:DNA polymerase III subunit gamma/tau [Deltaproteobacteria bacterium]
MSYQVLARKWRPQDFGDVVGQDAVVKTLKTALETGRVAHAYLFTGSRGVGKTTLARIMAKTIATEAGEAGVQDRKEIAEGTSVDVMEIDGASNNSVDAIREIREVARFMPQRCKYKIFIIDEVHMLSTSAFNALLKILEEPPDHVKFIFATTEPHKLPVTILSRCQRYDFKRISTARIVERLQFVLQQEEMGIDDAGLMVIARAAEGGMRDALSLTDQVLSFAGGTTTISHDNVTEALGLIDRRSIMKLTYGVVDRDVKVALDVIEAAFSRGHDLRQLAEGLANEMRNLTLAKSVGSIEGYADLADADVAQIDEKAASCDAKDLQRLFNQCLESIDLVVRAEKPRLSIELAVIRMCDRPAAADVLRVSEAISRLDLLARGKPVPPSKFADDGPATTVAKEAIGVGVVAQQEQPRHAPPQQEPRQSPPQQEPRQSPPQQEQPRQSPPQQEQSALPQQESQTEDESFEEQWRDPTRGLFLEGVDQRWLAFLDAISPQAPSLAGTLEHGHPIQVDDTGVTLAFKNILHETNAKNADSQIVELGLKAFNAGARFDVVTAEENGELPISVAESRRIAIENAERALRQHAAEHPVIQKALALFGGKLKSVRR